MSEVANIEPLSAHLDFVKLHSALPQFIFIDKLDLQELSQLITAKVQFQEFTVCVD
jgi:hypothetical protein